MTLLLLFLLNLTNLINSYRAYNIKSLSVIFWLSLFIFFNIPHTIEVLNVDTTYKLTILNKASLFSTLFNILFLFFDILLQRRKNNYNIDFFPKTFNLTRFNFLLLLILIISALIWSFGLYTTTGNILGSTWSDMREVDSKYMLLGNYLYIASASCTLAFYLAKRKDLAIISLITSVYLVLLIKSRINIIPLIMPFVIYYLYNSRLSFKTILKSILMGVLIIFIVFFLQQIRYLGSLENINKNYLQQAVSNTIERIQTGEGEFNLRSGFYLFIENDNNFANFGEGNTYKRLLLWFAPSKIIKMKPRDFAYDMWDAVYPEQAGTGKTYHPIFYGDAYGNFGFFGFLVALIWVIFFKSIDYFNRITNYRIRIALLSPLSIMFVLLARGAVYNAVVFFLWTGIIILFFIFISRLRLKSESQRLS